MKTSPAGVGAAVGSTMILGGYGSITTANLINSIYSGFMRLFGHTESSQLIDPQMGMWGMVIGSLFLILSIYAWVKKR